VAFNRRQINSAAKQTDNDNNSNNSQGRRHGYGYVAMAVALFALRFIRAADLNICSVSLSMYEIISRDAHP